jgi:hypothetical protein
MTNERRLRACRWELAAWPQRPAAVNVLGAERQRELRQLNGGGFGAILGVHRTSFPVKTVTAITARVNAQQ